jgi:hypothetical protein
LGASSKDHRCPSQRGERYCAKEKTELVFIPQRGPGGLSPGPFGQAHAILNKFHAALFENAQDATTMFFAHLVGPAFNF